MTMKVRGLVFALVSILAGSILIAIHTQATQGLMIADHLSMASEIENLKSEEVNKMLERISDASKAIRVNILVLGGFFILTIVQGLFIIFGKKKSN